MGTHIALHHQAHRRVASAPLGVFSDQDKAKAACQRIEDAWAQADAPGDGLGGTRLTWWDTGTHTNAWAQADDGDMYEVILAELDVPL